MQEDRGKIGEEIKKKKLRYCNHEAETECKEVFGEQIDLGN